MNTSTTYSREAGDILVVSRRTWVLTGLLREFEIFSGVCRKWKRPFLQLLKRWNRSLHPHNTTPTPYSAVATPPIAAVQYLFLSFYFNQLFLFHYGLLVISLSLSQSLSGCIDIIEFDAIVVIFGFRFLWNIEAWLIYFVTNATL